MYTLKRVFDFYINSSIHVALAVCCLSSITLLHFDLPIDKPLLLFTFCASVSGYNFVKYFGMAKFYNRGLSDGLPYIKVLSLISVIAMLYFALSLHLKTLVYLAILGFVTFFYAMPLLPKKHQIGRGVSLRAVGGLKIFIIGLVWTMVTVWMPLVNAEYNFDHDTLIISIQRFLYVLVAMLPFEIRDMKYDSLKLSTIPQLIGVKGTKILGILLLIPFFFLEYLKDTIQSSSVVVLLIVMILLMISLVMSKTQQSRYVTLFWVEAIPMVWLTLLILLI